MSCVPFESIKFQTRCICKSVSNSTGSRTMSFSSRRRNYLLTPHRRDGLIEWMKSMLHHSFVLDALESTAADTFSHFEMLIDEHMAMSTQQQQHHHHHHHHPSRLKQVVPTVGTFHTRLPLRTAFLAYNEKYAITKRKHVCISFNEIRQILNLAQIMALRDLHRMEKGKYDTSFLGPRMITLDGDQTLYADGANFESNPTLAYYLYSLLTQGVTIAVVTAAGYEYQTEKYHVRLSGLLAYFRQGQLPPDACQRFYLLGGECNYLMQLRSDYQLYPVEEYGTFGWLSITQHLLESPANWIESQVTSLLDVAETCFHQSIVEQKIRGRVLRKKRSVGLIPLENESISREALDETVLRVQALLRRNDGLPYCAFNGGRDAWFDVGNKRVGVSILSSYLNIPRDQMLHIGDQFLNTGNDFAARDVCPCVWIISPTETSFILKNILKLAKTQWVEDQGRLEEPCVDWLASPVGASSLTGKDHALLHLDTLDLGAADNTVDGDFAPIEMKTPKMNVYTGELLVD